jgi:protein-ribulosamine 3-kinase
MTLQSRIELAISSSTEQETLFVDSKTAHGGCISDSRIVTLKDGRQFFVKTNPEAKTCPGLFETEYDALLLLSDADVIHVPKPVVCDDDFIVMETFTEGAPASDWQEQMGRGLAELHKNTKTDRFGFAKDNYLGLSKQVNNWKDDWLSFWREQRLGLQLKRLAMITDQDDPLLVKGKKLMSRLELLLADIEEPAVLLHGDLWSGNAAANEQGQPVIFDPASYYGHREAEIGMMRMFGGFDARCEAAYAEVWPLQDGSEQRIRLYRLYHELNHLILFGYNYYRSCLATIDSLI